MSHPPRRVAAARIGRAGRGLLATLAVLAFIEAVRGTALDIPNPAPLFFVAVVYAAFTGGIGMGLLSAAVAFAYTLYFLSIPGAPLHYSDPDLRRLVVIAIAAPAVAVMVGVLRRRAEALLEARAKADLMMRYRDIVEDLDAIVWEADARLTRFTFVSRQVERVLGYSAAHLVANAGFLAGRIHPDDAEAALAERRRAAEAGLDHELEYRLIGADGRVVWVRDIARVARDAQGVPRRMRGLMLDVTERKRAETALKEQSDLLRSILDHMSDGVVVVDEHRKFMVYNPAAERITGTGPADVPPSEWTERYGLFRPDGDTTYPVDELPLSRALRGEAVDGAELWIRPPDVQPGRLVSVTARPLRDARGARRGAVAVFSDITERRRAEKEMRDSEERYRLLFESNPQPMWVYENDSLRFLAVNEAAIQSYGYSREEFLAMTLKDIRPEEDVPALLDSIHRVQPGLYAAGVWRHRKKDGAIIEVEITIHPLSFMGQAARLTLANDVTERRRAERALRTERDHSAIIIQATPSMVCGLAPSGSTLFMNPAAEAVTGYTAADIVGRSFWQTFYPGDEYGQAEQISREIEEGDVRDCEMVLTTRTGEKRTIAWSFVRRLDETGKLIEIVGFGNDITERRGLEEQLRQSQKMEAVGRLAGGVAHDFNNLMTAVTGYSELLLRREKKKDGSCKELEEIHRAGERAAELTRQLLAFGRRQVMKPRVVDLNGVVAGMDSMLRRLIGEDIDLLTALSPDLGQVKVDPGQIEQALMNLALNSRDAMPSGGKLTISTTNVSLDEAYARRHVGVRPGPYAMLAVSDTGSGIDAQTRSHLFEPFFTTKGQAQATGLGLSTVYGIVKQSGGHIFVYSEPGRGTTIKIYLPRVEDPVEVAPAPDARGASAGGSETILLVEDEDAVRSLARDILEMNGYKVLVARDGAEGLQICERHHGTIDLLLTDVVMPHMSGRDLVDRAGPLRPAMRVLYMSGYTGDAIVHQGVLAPGSEMLEKPFTVAALVRKVRDMLDAARATGE